jgi:hypothetical protein
METIAQEVLDILNDEFFEGAPTIVEMSYLYKHLKQKYDFDQIVSAYEYTRGKNIPAELYSQLRTNCNLPNNNFI